MNRHCEVLVRVWICCLIITWLAWLRIWAEAEGHTAATDWTGTDTKAVICDDAIQWGGRSPGYCSTIGVELWHNGRVHGSWNWEQRETIKLINKTDKYRIRQKVCGKRKLREERSRGFIPKNYLTSNIKNDIRRTKSDFATPIPGINMETLSLSYSPPEQTKIVFMDLCSTCDCLNVSLFIIHRRTSLTDWLYPAYLHKDMYENSWVWPINSLQQKTSEVLVITVIHQL